MKKTIITCMLLAVTMNLAAQYNPQSGGEYIPEFYSPYFIGMGQSVTSDLSPMADLINPAAGADKQRVTLDLSYAALVGVAFSGAGSGYGGHVFNLGGSFPTRAGVLGTSLHVLSSDLTAANLGTRGELGVSFAKDLFDDLHFGIGLQTGIDHNTDWMLTGSFGFLHYPGDVLFMRDMEWGASIVRLGKSFTPASGYSAVPSPFTLNTGIAFRLVDNDTFLLEPRLDLRFPYFQNVQLNTGFDARIAEVVTVGTAIHLDAHELLSASVPARSFIPSFFVGLRFETELSSADNGDDEEEVWRKHEINTRAAAAPLQNDVWAIGVGANIPLGTVDNAGPSIKVEYPQAGYVSPNQDGVQDSLVVPVSITDERYIKGYVFKLLNEDGEVVRRIENKEERPENKSFKNILDRLLEVKSGIEIPEEIRWDGTDDGGARVPDGTYTFVLESWDDNGNSSKTQVYTVIVDDTPPEVQLSGLSETQRIFSPNNDGRKDELQIEMDGSTEESWSIQITSVQGDLVRKDTLTNTAPSSWVWDGNDDQGNKVPDGVYSFSIESTDMAGNVTEKTVENIIVDTEPTPIKFAISTAFFSPNGDGSSDTIEFTTDVPVKKGILKWRIDIRNKTGSTEAVIDGSANAPDETIVFNGRNAAGSRLAEGRYTATLVIEYKNGNVPEQTSPEFTIDVTPPDGSVNTAYDVFSPNGDGNKDVMYFYQESTEEDVWKGEIVHKGSVIKTFTWREAVTQKAEWDGKTDIGLIAPDGTYSYILTSQDRAGNSWQSSPVEFSLNTEETPVFLSVNTEAFSPNNDGVKDTIKLTPQLKVAAGISSYKAKITTADNTVVKSYAGRSKVPASFSWNGIKDSGERADDGVYSASLVIEYTNGNKPMTRSGEFYIDTVIPEISLEPQNVIFSPNRDGQKDTCVIKQDATEEDLWEARITDSGGAVVNKAIWQGVPDTFVWPGTDTSGNTVPDGTYSYRVFAKDKAGNTASAEVNNIVVDTRNTPVYLTVNARGFSPNEDGAHESLTFKPIVKVQDLIERWDFSVLDNDGKPIKTVSDTSGSAPSDIIWDGKADNEAVIEGVFTSQLVVVYKNGNRPLAKSSSFAVDITPPVVRTDLSPLPFSPDNDGIDDELKISIRVSELTEVKKWKLSIFDPEGNYFHGYSGTGEPGNTIIWDGRSKNGELVEAAVDYDYRMTIEDAYGNVAVYEEEIPVDVLVIKDGDKYKIRISSIIFAPNSPQFSSKEQELDTNVRILDRIAQILKKYRQYKIRIEGHAVITRWADPEAAKKEQTEELIPLSKHRAETVKKALIERGLDPARFETVGIGGSDPFVPHSDLENRWKNRRVEFILVR